MRWLALVVTLLAAPRMVGAQATGIEAKYHGVLSIRRATGTIDRSTGNGTIRVQNWIALVLPDSNGIHPDVEAALVTVGLNDDQLPLPAGTLKKSRNGKSFSFRAKKSDPTRIRSFRVWLRADGSYGIRFAVTGIELSQLQTSDPICVPIAIIIGDDDFFKGISITSPSFSSKRVVIPEPCTLDPDEWTWIRG